MSIDMLVVDWHGCLRTKRLPDEHRGKLLDGQARLPLSTQAQDMGNDDRDDLIGLSLIIGDPDGLFIAEPRTLASQPWRMHRGGEQVLGSLHEAPDVPSPFDSREVLKRQIACFAKRGYRAVAAIELEFYLLDSSAGQTGRPAVPEGLRVAGAAADNQLCEPRVVDRVEAVLDRIDRYARELELPAETSLAEIGPGQFEVNLAHRDDALHAADDAVLFRRVVDRAAFDEGMLATFMAKPYTEHAGSGQHVHISVLDENRRNVLDTTHDPERLYCAVAGLLDTMTAAQLLFAPNGNSYRRLQPGEFAPSRIDWGYDHRGVALRLPETSGAGTRIEHRLAGADANTYLVLAAIMSGMLLGMDRRLPPDIPPLMPGEKPNAHYLTHDWMTAIETAESSAFLRELLGNRFTDAYLAIKRHEALSFGRQVSDVDWQTYLKRI